MHLRDITILRKAWLCSFSASLLRRVNLGEIDINNISFTPEEFAELVEMADTEKVSKNDAKSPCSEQW